LSYPKRSSDIIARLHHQQEIAVGYFVGKFLNKATADVTAVASAAKDAVSKI
jgi:hypothetical protein